MANKKTLEQQIGNVVNTLKDRYRPERIFLFGSAAKGKVGKNSDLDFFIVKKTKKRLLDRIEEVDGLFLERSLPLDFLVYTPKEVRQRLALGDSFVGGILEQGKLLYDK